MHNLPGSMKIVPAVPATAGSVAAFTAVEVNGTGYSRACFVVDLGTAASGGTFDCKVTNSDVTGGTFHDVTGAALTQVTKAAGDGKVEIIDMPITTDHPILKLSGSVGTGAWPNSAICILYNGSRINPPTQAAGQTIQL